MYPLTSCQPTSRSTCSGTDLLLATTMRLRSCKATGNISTADMRVECPCSQALCTRECMSRPKAALRTGIAVT